MEPSIGNLKTVRPARGHAGHAYGLAPGERLGPYRILRPLGAGGMGEVYLAEHTQMHKQYALKVLPAAVSGESHFLGRFSIEARVMADLDHPRIVRVHHMDSDQGRFYLTMDFVAGPDGDPYTLEDLLEDVACGESPPLPEQTILSLAEQICAGLSYAHRKGIVHRDLKPSNVLLETTDSERDGPLSVRLADFGLAKVLGDAYLLSIIERSASLSIAGQAISEPEEALARSIGDVETLRPRPRYERTTTRSILGTYDYMSPEQKAGGVITPQSDLYAFGVLLYRMLTGRKPEGRFKLPSAFGRSRGWDAIVSHCLEPDPADRPASAVALHMQLQRLSNALQRRQRIWRYAIGGLIGLALLAGTAVWQLGGGKKTEPPPSPPPPPPIKHAEPMEEITAPPREVEEARDQAQTAFDSLAALNTSNGFGQWMDRVSNQLNDAMAAFSNGNYNAAATNFTKITDRTDQLSNADRFRQGALAARDRAMANRGKAQLNPVATQAREWAFATNAMQQAETLLGDGTRWMSTSNWMRASNHWTQAADYFQTAAAYVVALPPPTAPKDPPAPVREQPKERAAGTVTNFQIYPNVWMEFCWIPPTTGEQWREISEGKTTFSMGSPTNEPGRARDDLPLQERTITRGFWMGRYEVTQAQWEGVMGDNPSAFRRTNGPVTKVSYGMCTQFIERLNRHAKTSSAYRFPTEAEWEYACRAGTVTPYHVGHILGTNAWHRGRRIEMPQPVGSSTPNRWGLHEMHGNAWEWCHNAAGPAPVLRGGSFTSLSNHCRSASRHVDIRGGSRATENDMGFRLLREEN